MVPPPTPQDPRRGAARRRKKSAWRSALSGSVDDRHRGREVRPARRVAVVDPAILNLAVVVKRADIALRIGFDWRPTTAHQRLGEFGQSVPQRCHSVRPIALVPLNLAAPGLIRLASRLELRNTRHQLDVLGFQLFELLGRRANDNRDGALGGGGSRRPPRSGPAPRGSSRAKSCRGAAFPRLNVADRGIARGSSYTQASKANALHLPRLG